MAWFTTKGKISYGNDPEMRKRADRPWVRVGAPNGIANYYRHMMVREIINPFRQIDVPMTLVHPPKIGAHITVLDGRADVADISKWGKHEGKIIEFEYSNEVEQIWKFFVLPVRCAFLDDLRSDLGLGTHPFHITIGRME